MKRLFGRYCQRGMNKNELLPDYINSRARGKVRKLTDNKVGRPVIYAIIDVFSRLVTGIYVGLEGPSWLGAMMELDNMICDKVEFCKKYGIDIKEEQWPCRHLPEIIIADRGEFEGYSVGNLINNLDIKVENTPPYRGGEGNR